MSLFNFSSLKKKLAQIVQLVCKRRPKKTRRPSNNPQETIRNSKPATSNYPRSMFTLPSITPFPPPHFHLHVVPAPAFQETIRYLLRESTSFGSCRYLPSKGATIKPKLDYTQPQYFNKPTMPNFLDSMNAQLINSPRSERAATVFQRGQL